MSNPYESGKLLGEYLLFHYGKPEEVLPDFAPQAMHAALDFAVRTPGHFETHLVERGLDLGCAVGRSSLEMSRVCQSVIGIDFSASFITAADRLKNGETLAYEVTEEASLTRVNRAVLPGGLHPERVQFEVGDAMNLRLDLGAFDRVHAANLLCRLPEPARLLDRLPSLVRSGGELVLATPCTWLEEFTPLPNWPEGKTLNWLQRTLGHDFELVRQAEEPFLIRETARKFQYTFSLVTVWRRR